MNAAAAPYSRPEELAHSLTAGLGIVACLFAIPWLMWVSFDDPRRLATALVFGLSALAMFVTSVVYHSAQNPELKVRLRKLDHSAIYLLIAGTYTPLALVAMERTWGWTLFAVIWALAVLGIVKKTLLGFRFPKLSIAMYVTMGWIAVIAIKPLTESLSAWELGWILAGGLLYTGGVPFYLWKTRRYMHAVWHVFVLAGVAAHFIAVLSIVRTD